ncbi:MAG: flavodoxin family protein [Paludibacteraceae bacterium]|nr:flavodoxin family protein [Paludibacteraceae bacterium]
MPKRVYIINGSPRKNYNTAQLLHAFADGAREADKEVEVTETNLYDLHFTGCRECYACKLRGGKNYGHCGYPDEITELLHNVAHADVVAFGSPIYFSEITAQLRGFLERLWYPFVQFKRGEPQIIAPKRVRTAFLITMNVGETAMRRSGYDALLQPVLQWTEYVFGYKPQVQFCYDTLQYRDYNRYWADAWNVEGKKIRHEHQFPLDLHTARQLGHSMTTS